MTLTEAVNQRRAEIQQQHESRQEAERRAALDKVKREHSFICTVLQASLTAEQYEALAPDMVLEYDHVTPDQSRIYFTFEGEKFTITYQAWGGRSMRVWFTPSNIQAPALGVHGMDNVVPKLWDQLIDWLVGLHSGEEHVEES